ncbi:MAG: hypothetical protein LIP08_00345 [Bacteroides sp.]|nr:hypothetical protein [Bacteroides sp.]
MKKIILIIWIVFIANDCNFIFCMDKYDVNLHYSELQTPVDSFLNIHVIGAVINSYYADYLKYPNNLTDIISYIQDINEVYPYPDSFPWDYIRLKLFPIFIEYRDTLAMIREDDSFSFFFAGKCISQIMMSCSSLNPCTMYQYVGISGSEYAVIRNRFLSFRYYDFEGKVIFKTEKLQEVLDTLIRECQSTYLLPDRFKKIMFEDVIQPYYLVLEYKYKEGLYLFCEEIPFFY